LICHNLTTLSDAECGRHVQLWPVYSR
jgi:hypothetical protein